MRNVSNTAKWVIAAICGILGIIALIYAVIYLAVPIHSLPGFVPGKQAAINGHYHKRALISAVIGIVLLAIAAYLGFAVQRSSADQGAGVAGPTPGPGPAPSQDAGEGGAVPS
jgi:uncharacterized membrane protein